MRKMFFYPLLFGLFLLNVAGTCCADDPEVVSIAKNNLTQVNSIISQGTWKVSYFLDKNSNLTSEYSGYNFTFGMNEILTSNNAANAFSGNWSVVKSNGIDDNPDNDLDFAISFSSPDTLMELTAHWDVTEITETKVRLKSKSGNVDGINYLTFEKK
ncbi:hypothetical protein E0I26_04555 [Flavobacterium rhamnosiphilum]|uniref:Lipocalin-like domain-containing protein n=1 Tax=Flavobacterium rhamnosiphilum TaxID=2541724 RepID=A0A4R5FBZ8_9FLAO|nr:hypothetical protein [Flavobacterium rhamnosiphilum]TDE45964.1 hypothetical protein E0I26_04555 [Flavobacterium rhamnosiphilum]